jgi:hypothetical protein
MSSCTHNLTFLKDSLEFPRHPYFSCATIKPMGHGLSERLGSIFSMILVTLRCAAGIAKQIAGSGWLGENIELGI